jgi:hypothetical protein
MRDLIMNLLLALVQLAAFALVTVALNFMIGKVGNEKFKSILGYAKILIASVEQTMAPGTGAAKKALVEAALSKKFGGKVTAEEIDHIIEAAVYEIKQATAIVTATMTPTATTTVTVTPTATAKATTTVNPPMNPPGITTSGEIKGGV